MKKFFNLSVLAVSIIVAVAAAACGNTCATKSENIDGVEWYVTVNKAMAFRDSITGVVTDYKYTVADTAAVNEILSGIMPCAGCCGFGWTVPGSDGSIWLVAYQDEPLLTERVTEAWPIPSYDGDIQVSFKFADAKKWAAITKENIGQRLAVFVNGRLMNAPQVNSEITSGNCAVSIPADMVHDYLPNLDLEKIRQ